MGGECCLDVEGWGALNVSAFVLANCQTRMQALKYQLRKDKEGNKPQPILEDVTPYK